MAETPSRVRLLVDSNRDGEVDPSGDGRWQWEWGAGRRGAIVVCDPSGRLDESRAAPIVLQVDPAIAGSPDAPDLLISVNAFAATRVTLWRQGPDGPVPLVGALAQAETVRIRPVERLQLWLTAHTFPDGGFDGLVELLADLGLRQPGRESRDRVVLRVAPWLMPAPSRPVEAIYVVHQQGWNSDFVARLEAAAEEAGATVREIAGEFADNDPWIQDEIEPGYTCGATGGPRHVIVDGPRDRGLDPVIETVFGADGVDVYSVPAHGGWPTSLDSFGNLEVSPPVFVDGVDYPLGRIVLGTAAPDSNGRQAALAIRQFLNAQQVQAPVEIFTDWLIVGHVDEIVCFEPGPGDGWRLQLASTTAFRQLLQRWEGEGHASAVLWEGKRRFVGGRAVSAARTVRQLLDDRPYWAYQQECQRHIDLAKAQLVKGLGLHGDDRFVEVPLAFERVGQGAAAAFPDMVNHLIIGEWSIVPDPFGPVVDGQDLLQAAYRALAPSRKVVFIDDWETYHLNLGEVHCGTNVLRTPDAALRWWEVQMPGLWDAAIPVSR